MAEHSKKKYFLIILLPLILAVVYIYYNYNPSVYPFPSCPSKKILGLACPGCGSQRAVHSLLHGNFIGAFFFNPLLIIAIPYIILGYIFQIKSIQEKYPQARKILFGKVAIIIVFIIIVSYWIARNIFHF